MRALFFIALFTQCLAWKVSLPGVSIAQVLENGVFASNGTSLSHINAKGAVEWTLSTDEIPWCQNQSPCFFSGMLAKDVVLLASPQPSLENPPVAAIKYNYAERKPVWTVSPHNGAMRFLVKDDVVFYIDFSSTVHAFKGGVPLWQYSFESDYCSGLISGAVQLHADDQVVLADCGGNYAGLDLQSGTKLWTVKPPNQSDQSLLQLTRDNLIFEVPSMLAGGSFELLDERTLKSVFHYNMTGGAILQGLISSPSPAQFIVLQQHTDEYQTYFSASISNVGKQGVQWTTPHFNWTISTITVIDVGVPLASASNEMLWIPGNNVTHPTAFIFSTLTGKPQRSFALAQTDAKAVGFVQSEALFYSESVGLIYTA